MFHALVRLSVTLVVLHDAVRWPRLNGLIFVAAYLWSFLYMAARGRLRGEHPCCTVLPVCLQQRKLGRPPMLPRPLFPYRCEVCAGQALE